MAKTKINIIERLSAPTPSFFKKLRNIGIGLAAVGGAIIATPVCMPTIIITLAGYLTVAGGIMTAVAQTTIEGE